MAWQRDEANLGISGATAYSYTEVDWSVNATHAVYRHIGGVTSPYNFGATATSTLQWWESGTWHDYAGPASHYFSGYGDQPILDVEDSFVRQAADRTVSLGCYTTMMGGGARAWIDYTVPHLAPSVTWASSNPVVRNSDNSITLTWNAPSLEYSAMCLEVSTDGGSWSQFAVLWNTATSYTWTGCSAGHSYQFRIRTNYLASYSAYDTCATIITMTPTAPTAISTAAISGGTDIAVTLENESSVATAIEWQYSTDNKATWSASTTVNGYPVTSFTATGITGTAYIRVANKNSTGTSAWLVSEAVTTICPPNPPTLTAPSGNVLDLADGNVTFAWLHNTLDGSAQSAAQLDYSTNGGSMWTSITSITTAQSYTMAIPWSAGTTVTWRVKTKGADASYSNWSSTKTFNVYTAPTLVITSPGATITGMPLSISATYSDMAGFTCQAATVTLPNGKTKNCTINGTAITASIGVDEWLPTNGESYTVVLTARSSSSLQTTVNATFAVAFVEPMPGELSISNDPDTGYASLLATFNNNSGGTEYSGDTNTQYDSETAYVRKLSVQGKTEKTSSRNLADTSTIYSRYIQYRDVHDATWKESSDSRSFAVPVTAGTTYYVKTYNNSVTLLRVACVENLPSGSEDILSTNAKSNALQYTITPTGNERYLVVQASKTYLDNGTADIMVCTGDYYPYEPYSAASLNSIESVGVVRNLSPVDIDEWEQGSINEGAAVGSSYNNLKVTYNNRVRVASLIQVEPSTSYTVYIDADHWMFYCCFHDGAYTGVYGGWLQTTTGSLTLTTDANTNAIGYAIRNKNNAAITPSDISDVVLRIVRTDTIGEIETTLRSAGSVNDILQVGKTSWTVERKVGSVNLGSLNWTALTTSGRNYFAAEVSGIKSGTQNVICPWAYTWQTYAVDAMTFTTTRLSTTTGLYVRDSGEYVDAAAFKTAMSGVYLFYELQTSSHDADTSISTMQVDDSFIVLTELDSTFDMTTWDGSADAVSISVARVNADGITPLIEDAASGAGAVDKYAPLNTPYQYAVTTKSSANAVKTVYVDNEIVTDLWFAYWGENVASAKWNPDNGGIQLTRPQKTRVYYAGRKDPVSYDGSAVALSETPSWMLVDRSEVQPFVQLVEDGGRGVYKSCDGWVYHADFDLTLTPKYTAIGYYGGIMLSVTRIAGEQL